MLKIINKNYNGLEFKKKPQYLRIPGLSVNLK
jgi:hypothetical protein